MLTNASRSEVLAAIECLRRLTDAFGRRRRQLARSVDLTEHQWRVLEEISVEHFMPSMFAKSNDSSPAAVSKTLKQLVDKGLITVALSRDDGRQRLYVLTAKGEQTLLSLRQTREDAIDHVWIGLTREQIQGFVGFAGTLTERLETYASHEDH